MQTNTKIIATIGPMSEKKTILKEMIRSGMRVARLNFSHGTYEHHEMLIHNIRAASKETKTPVALLQDIQGPRIRVGVLPKVGALVKEGDTVILTAQKDYDKQAMASGYAVDKKTNGFFIPIQYEKLYQFVHPKGYIYIQDGLIELRVISIRQKRIYCRVTQGGTIHTHKGLNAPDVVIKAPIVTVKDKQDIAFGVEMGVDYIALSFVQNAAQIKQVRKLLPKQSPVKLIAKIEQAEAVRNFQEILEQVDGIMVARGDLGVELGSAEVPVLQKQMITDCVAAGKPVIVATQMLESMTQNPRPTRAEAADVANAVIDHTDAVMLSAETATGQFPVKVIRTMTEIIQHIEQSPLDDILPATVLAPTLAKSSSQGIAHAAVHVAQTLSAKAIIVVSASGRTTQFVSQMRPQSTTLLGVHTDDQMLRQYQLLWGVHPVKTSTLEWDALRREMLRYIRKHKIARKGDHVVFVAGFHLQQKAAVVEAVEV